MEEYRQKSMHSDDEKAWAGSFHEEQSVGN
jgi:hypothetical protein